MSRLRKAADIRVAPVVDQSAAQHDSDVEAAFAAGRAEGEAKGRADALDTTAQATARGAAALEALLTRTGAASAAASQAASGAVLTAALEVAQWVLRAELAGGGRALLGRLEIALEELLPAPETRIHVCPSDAVVVRSWAVAHTGLTVVVDPALAPGDALVRSGSGDVDVTVAAALRVAADVLSVDAPIAVALELAA